MARSWKPLSDEEILARIPAARERGRLAAETEPRAVAARYNPETGWTILELSNGCMFAFPPDVDEVRDLTPEERARVRVRPGGRGLYWEGTDASLSVPGLIAGGEYAPRAEQERRGYMPPRLGGYTPAGPAPLFPKAPEGGSGLSPVPGTKP